MSLPASHRETLAYATAEAELVSVLVAIIQLFHEKHEASYEAAIRLTPDEVLYQGFRDAIVWLDLCDGILPFDEDDAVLSHVLARQLGANLAVALKTFSDLWSPKVSATNPYLLETLSQYRYRWKIVDGKTLCLGIVSMFYQRLVSIVLFKVQPYYKHLIL